MVLRIIRKAEFWAFAFALIVLVPWIYAETFEPRWNPVITRIELTSAGSDPDGTIIAGSATRLRECSWIETRWWLGRRGEQRVPVEVRYKDRPQVRETGETSWSGIIIVNLTPSQTIKNSHADAVYNCYSWWPWSQIEISVPFYDGLGQDSDLLSALSADEQRELFEDVQQLRDQLLP